MRIWYAVNLTDRVKSLSLSLSLILSFYYIFNLFSSHSLSLPFIIIKHLQMNQILAFDNPSEFDMPLNQQTKSTSLSLSLSLLFYFHFLLLFSSFSLSPLL